MTTTEIPASSSTDLDGFRRQVRAFLASNLGQKDHGRPTNAGRPDHGDLDVSIFHDLTFEQEQALVARRCEWQALKFAAGYGALSWPVEFGGAGLSSAHEKIVEDEEGNFEVPDRHEVCGVTTGLVAPTIRAFGTDEQKERFIRPFLDGSQLCSQLFSEPGAGSDLAGVATKAVRDGEEWVLSGQKIWSSGAQYAQWGLALCRTDSSVPKHAGQTMFLVPLDHPGVEVRPIRQMSGGASFNEVFLTEARIPDSLRIGPIGEGWKVALTTLSFERSSSGSHSTVGGNWELVLQLARQMGKTDDPVIRQQLAHLYSFEQVRHYQALRNKAVPAGGVPGPGGSLGKLTWTIFLAEVSAVVSNLLGASMTADTGEWGTFAWNKHLLGAPGYRIAGGSDEIQRNIIGERVLGLPGEPRVDRNVPFSQVPK